MTGAKLLTKHESIVCFIIAFLLLFLKIYPMPDMIYMSGDSTSIWATITSFYADKIISSYVLYKGFLSIYPYVWLYKLAITTGLNEFIFIKIYNCLIFGYVAGVGLPYLVNKLLRVNASMWQRIFLILFLLWIWDFNTALYMISVDLPSFAVFVLAANSALKIRDHNYKRPLLGYLYAGLICGLGLCFSGQYSIGILCILLFILIQIFNGIKSKDTGVRAVAIIAIAFLILGVISVKGYNYYFEQNVVNPMREAGEWVPTGSQWILGTGMTQLTYQKYGTGSTIIDNRGTAIIKELEGDNYEKIKPALVAGAYPVNIKIYTDLIIKHPLDFIVRWCNRLFLGMSPDNSIRSISHLFLNYTLIFLALYEIKKRCIMVKDVFTSNALIPLAFLATVLPACFLHVEMRYFISLQGFTYGIAILSNTSWGKLREFQCLVIKYFKQKKFPSNRDSNFPYGLILYLIFMVFCFAHFASIYDLIGSNPEEILFTF